MARANMGRLISHINWQSRIYVRRRLQGYDIGSGEHRFLMALFRCEGSSQEMVGRILGVDKANSARASANLVRKGYIMRKRNPSDRRSYLLYLTDEGKAMRPVLRSVLDDLLSELTRGVGEEDLRTALRVLGQMDRNAARINGKEPIRDLMEGVIEGTG